MRRTKASQATWLLATVQIMLRCREHDRREQIRLCSARCSHRSRGKVDVDIELHQIRWYRSMTKARSALSREFIDMAGVYTRLFQGTQRSRRPALTVASYQGYS